MAKRAFFFLALIVVSSSSLLHVEANPAPEAKSDPRDYVLIPMKDLVEDSEENLPAEETEAPEFRSAEAYMRWPRPRGRRPFPRWRSAVQESVDPEFRTAYMRHPPRPRRPYWG